MRCVNCTGQFITRRGDLKLINKILGDLIVENTEWDECEGCGEKLYSPVTLRGIEKVEEERKNELLLKRPLGEFISGTEAGKILNKSRQAVHKDPRIRRGFIHFVKYDHRIYYLKKSVILFNKTGDGRFSLAKSIKTSTKVIYLAEIQGAKKRKSEWTDILSSKQTVRSSWESKLSTKKIKPMKKICVATTN